MLWYQFFHGVGKWFLLLPKQPAFICVHVRSSQNCRGDCEICSGWESTACERFANCDQSKSNVHHRSPATCVSCKEGYALGEGNCEQGRYFVLQGALDKCHPWFECKRCWTSSRHTRFCSWPRHWVHSSIDKLHKIQSFPATECVLRKHRSAKFQNWKKVFISYIGDTIT